MTEKFTWGDEKTPKENRNLERQVATEEDYNNYITNRINSAKDKWERWGYLAKVAERDKFKDGGFTLQYYKTGEEINWSVQIQTLKK